MSGSDLSFIYFHLFNIYLIYYLFVYYGLAFNFLYMYELLL